MSSKNTGCYDPTHFLLDDWLGDQAAIDAILGCMCRPPNEGPKPKGLSVGLKGQTRCRCCQSFIWFKDTTKCESCRQFFCQKCWDAKSQ